MIKNHEEALKHPETHLYRYLVVEKGVQTELDVEIPHIAKHDFKDDLYLEIKSHLDESHIHQAIQEFYEKLDLIVDHDGDGFFQISDSKGDLKKTVFVSFIPSKNRNKQNHAALIKVNHL